MIAYAIEQRANGARIFDAELICRRDAALDQWVKGIESRGVRVHRTDLRGLADFNTVRRVMRAGDVVHLVLAYPSGKYQLVSALLARAAARPLVVTHQLVIDIRDIPMSGMRRAFWRLAFRAYRVARHNIASSRAGWDLLVKRYGYSPGSTVLIYNGGNLSLFKPLDAVERPSMRRSMGSEIAGEPWAEDVLICCTVARLSVQKGLLDLVNAAATVAGSQPNVRFVLIGDGELRNELEREVGLLHLERHVVFAGARPLAVLAGWLGAADLFVMSSHYEGMPLSMIEAMAAACPVVATSVGGVPDILDGVPAGMLVPAKNPVALADAILTVLRDNDRRLSMRTAARDRAVSTFDVRICYQKTTELYGAAA